MNKLAMLSTINAVDPIDTTLGKKVEKKKEVKEQFHCGQKLKPGFSIKNDMLSYCPEKPKQTNTTNLNNHLTNTNNPHDTNKNNISPSNVENFRLSTRAEIKFSEIIDWLILEKQLTKLRNETYAELVELPDARHSTSCSSGIVPLRNFDHINFCKQVNDEIVQNNSLDNYQIAVNHGFSGTEQDWLDSLNSINVNKNEKIQNHHTTKVSDVCGIKHLSFFTDRESL